MKPSLARFLKYWLLLLLTWHITFLLTLGLTEGNIQTLPWLLQLHDIQSIKILKRKAITALLPEKPLSLAVSELLAFS